MRKFARSKWALGLFGVLIFSFGFVGLRGCDNPNGGVSIPFLSAPGYLSEVGGRPIFARDLSLAVDRAIDQLREQQNKSITPAQAAKDGTTSRALSQLEYRNAMLAYAEHKGIAASDVAVNDLLIKQSGVLKDAFGKVTENALQQLAERQKMTVREFEKAVREDITTDYLTSAILKGMTTPDILTAPMVNFLGESRTLLVAQFDDKLNLDPPPPTEAEMKTYYDAHKDDYRVGERRRITVLRASPENFLDKVEFTEEQLKAEYQKRIKTYSTPEVREISEFTSTDVKQVQNLVDLMKQGIKADEALKRVTNVTRKDRTAKPDDLTPKPYSDVVFGLAANGVYGPGQLVDNGLYVAVQVNKITPGIAKPYAEVAQQVRSDVMTPEARRLYDKNRDDFDKAAESEELEAMGKEFGFPVTQLEPVDNRGRTLKGEPVALLTSHPEAIQQLFGMGKGETTEVFEDDHERTIYRLDEIIPPLTQAFEDVKERVQLAMMAERRIAALDKATTDMIAQVKAGKGFEAAAQANKLKALPPITTTRAQGTGFDPTAMEAAFNLKLGDVSVVRSSTNVPFVIRVEKIEPATAAVRADLKARVGAQVSDLLQNDIGEVFARGLLNEEPVKRDENAIAKYLESYNKDDQQQ